MNKEERDKAICAAAVIAAGIMGIIIVTIIGVVLLFS